jgi:hypothetical protein
MHEMKLCEKALKIHGAINWKTKSQRAPAEKIIAQFAGENSIAVPTRRKQSANESKPEKITKKQRTNKLLRGKNLSIRLVNRSTRCLVRNKLLSTPFVCKNSCKNIFTRK